MIPSLKGKRYGFGGKWHRSKNNSTCDAHLYAILQNGKLSKSRPFGHSGSFLALSLIPLSQGG